MWLGLTIGEAARATFGAGLTLFSFWYVYVCAIKPQREMRRQQAWAAIAEMHRNYWRQLSRPKE